MADDSWRDTYDEWKLACPYDDEQPEDTCDHEEYEVDWEGRAECHYCGARLRSASGRQRRGCPSIRSTSRAARR